MNRQVDPQISWAAGFFDGEGCVSIGRGIERSKSGKEWLRHQLSIIVAQRVRKPLDLYVYLFGGKVTNFKINGAVYFQYKLHGKKAADFLEQIVNYLIVKGDSARLGINFQEYLDKTRPRPTVKRSDEEIETLETYYQVGREFNALYSHKDYTAAKSIDKETHSVQ